MVNQQIVEDGNKRSLQEFTDSAVEFLQAHPDHDEVIQHAFKLD